MPATSGFPAFFCRHFFSIHGMADDAGKTLRNIGGINTASRFACDFAALLGRDAGSRYATWRVHPLYRNMPVCASLFLSLIFINLTAPGRTMMVWKLTHIDPRERFSTIRAYVLFRWSVFPNTSNMVGMPLFSQFFVSASLHDCRLANGPHRVFPVLSQMLAII